MHLAKPACQLPLPVPHHHVVYNARQGTLLDSFREERRARLTVLRRLGHVSASDGTVLLKGRAACEIDTADELLTAGACVAVRVSTCHSRRCWLYTPSGSVKVWYVVAW
jgi:hypothetical protein